MEFKRAWFSCTLFAFALPLLFPGHQSQVTAFTVEEKIQDSEALILYFYATGCSSCQNMKLAVDMAAKELKDRIEVQKLDFELPKGAKIAAQFGVNKPPAVIALKKGIEKGRLEGLVMRGNIVNWIKSMAPKSRHKQGEVNIKAIA